MADVVKSIKIKKSDSTSSERPIALSKSLTISYDNKDYIFNGEEDVNLSLSDIKTKAFIIGLTKIDRENNTPIYQQSVSFNQIKAALQSGARIELTYVNGDNQTYHLGLSSYNVSADNSIHVLTFVETEVKYTSSNYISTNGFMYTHTGDDTNGTDTWTDITCTGSYFRLAEQGSNLVAADDLDMNSHHISNAVITSSTTPVPEANAADDIIANKGYVDAKFNAANTEINNVKNTVPTFAYDETTQTLTITAATSNP